MPLKLLSVALAACALAWSQAALASVTYTYAGATFTEVNVVTYQPDLPPEASTAASAAARLVLLNDRLGLTLTTPAPIPAGWSSFDAYGIYGALAAVAGSGIDWSFTNSAFGGTGHILQDNLPQYDPWSDSSLTVSLHVGSGHVIDAWQISFAPAEMYGPPNWNIHMAASSTSGDVLHYEFGAAHYYQSRDAATATPGSWTMSAVPAPAPAALWLVGLGTLALLRKRRA